MQLGYVKNVNVTYPVSHTPTSSGARRCRDVRADCAWSQVETKRNNGGITGETLVASRLHVLSSKINNNHKSQNNSSSPYYSVIEVGFETISAG